MEYTVHAKEKLYFMLLATISLAIYVGWVAAAYFIPQNILGGTIFSVIFLLFNLFAHTYLIGYLKGNAIKINHQQFPEIYEILTQQSHKLGLKTVPSAYLLQGHGMMNAFATRFAKKNYVVLYSDVLAHAYQEGKSAVEFIIGHELGHITRNHLGALKSLFLAPARMIPLLGAAYSRGCEYTCDNIGYHLAPEGAEKGILILAAGKYLYKKVNVPEMLATAKQEQGFATWLAEIFATHPHLVKRIAAINQLNQDNQGLDSFIIPGNKATLSQLDVH